MSVKISVPDMYSQVTKSGDTGIQGYHVQKVYCDPLEQIKQRQYAKIKKGEKSRQHQTKRGNFLDDEAKLHKFCPGPGTYKSQLQWPQKQKLRRNVADKMTYIDEIIKHQKKNKNPAPGSYNVIKTMKQLQKEKKQLAMKKINHQDKISFLDNVQFESTLVPGAGNYNPRVRAKTETSDSKMQKKPQDWRKIHQEKDKKKPQKAPDMRTYKPMPAFELFQSMDKKKGSKNCLGKTERFKTMGGAINLPPHKYSIIQNWRGKTVGKDKQQRHGLQSVSKGLSKSVYYH